MINNKSDIRKNYLLIRKKIEDKINKSKLICDKVKDMDEYKKARTIAIYKSLANEVNTCELINYSLNNNKIVLLPRVCDNNLKFYKITNEDKFVKSEFGILEPISDNDKLVNSEDIDLIIIPGICFDKFKNRVGFGKGYYDRYLERTNIKKIGICFEEQILKDGSIKTDNNDIKMDIIVTDKFNYY